MGEVPPDMTQDPNLEQVRDDAERPYRGQLRDVWNLTPGEIYAIGLRVGSAMTRATYECLGYTQSITAQEIYPDIIWASQADVKEFSERNNYTNPAERTTGFLNLLLRVHAEGASSKQQIEELRQTNPGRAQLSLLQDKARLQINFSELPGQPDANINSVVESFDVRSLLETLHILISYKQIGVNLIKRVGHKTLQFGAHFVNDHLDLDENSRLPTNF